MSELGEATAATPAAFDLAHLGAKFQLEGAFLSAERWGAGHINDTFRSTWRAEGRLRRYIHQRINDHVFPDPEAVMANIAAVTQHVRRKLEAAAESDLDRRVLTLVPARDGRDFHVDADGHFWRTYLFVEGSRSVDVMEDTGQAERAGRAFGRFLVQLADYEGPRLHETITGFHDTPRRFRNFVRALQTDALGRAAGCAAEIESLLAEEETAGRVAALHEKGLLVERIAHNDTKLNNLLLDEVTGEALCVIDLDTVMPGYALHDFGDLVRTGAARAAEDERDLAKVGVDVSHYEALVRGYLGSAGPHLSPTEREHLATGAEVIVLENALRFLTDHLEGDEYFKIHRPGHNLDRCRTQLAFYRDLSDRGEALRRLIESLAAEAEAGAREERKG